MNEIEIKTKPYKAIYAFVMAGLTAATAIYTDVTWLVILLAALTPLGTYFVTNPVTEVRQLPDDMGAGDNL